MRAFVLRLAPADIDRVAAALASGEISIGWGKAGAEHHCRMSEHAIEENEAPAPL